MKWYIMALKKYTDFKTRSRRSEYWWFLVFYIIFSIVVRVTDYLLGWSASGTISGGGWLTWLYGLAMFIPGLAINVRRLHDIGKSGWVYVGYGVTLCVLFTAYVVYLVSLFMGKFSMEDLTNGDVDAATIMSVFTGKFFLITFLWGAVVAVLFIWYLVLMFRDSAPGENKWGRNPKEVVVDDMVM